MRFLIATFFLLLKMQAFACRVDAPASLNIFTDLEAKTSQYFKDNIALDQPLVFNISGCEQTAIGKKALMIAVGAEQFGWEDTKRSISFTGEYNDDKCTIADSPMALMPFAEKFKHFKKKNDYLKKCIEVRVVNTGLRPLAYSPTQQGCIINKISNQEASFQGGFCFFKPTADSSYQVTLKIKDSCRDMQGLQNILQGPQELTGAVNFYIAGDDTGTSPDLTAVKSTPLTVSINPLASLMPLAFDAGVAGPHWPGQWVFPDIHLAKVAITSSGDSYKIQTPLLVNHRCPAKCVGTTCSGPCDYALPLAGEFVLKDITGGKEIYLNSWYDGGFAPANWQGLIWGQGQLVDKSFLQAGRRYKIEFHLMDPKVDFDIFKNKMKKKLGSINARLGRISPGEVIGGISNIPDIQAGGEIPNIGGVNSSIGAPLGDLDSALLALNSRLGFGNWPPLYEESCSTDLASCKRSPSYVVKYELSFDVTADNGGRSLELANYEVKRQSPYSADYKAKPTDLPRVICQ